MTQKVVFTQTILNYRIMISSNVTVGRYFIEQMENHRFNITADNGYDWAGNGCAGFATVENAISHIKKLVINNPD